MCWNVEISVASCLIGWITCILLLFRNRSPRDLFYARYLFTFTFTQLVDIVLWSLHAKGGLEECVSFQLAFSTELPAGQEVNYLVSKYVIPLVVFSQHCMQWTYPSVYLVHNRRQIILYHMVPCLLMCFFFACTRVTSANFPVLHDTLFWGGNFTMFPTILIQIGATLHSGLVAWGFYAIMPGRVMWAHLLPITGVVCTLIVTEGRMDFGSKWCTYCLIYSFVYLTEPLWLPKEGIEKVTPGAYKFINKIIV